MAIQACAGAPAVESAGATGTRTCSAAVTTLDTAFARIDSLLTARLTSDAIPGMAAAVVCGPDFAWTRGYGVGSIQDPVPVSPDTRFRIASITKLFTATAVMKLHEDGAIRLDDAVRDRLPWFSLRRKPAAGEAPVTIRQLLTHTSGLPRDSRLTNFPRLYQPPREAAIAVFPSETLQTAPGSTAAYSNLGYAVLGEVVRNASSLEFAHYLEREILTPIGMAETLVHPDSSAEVAWGHGPVQSNGRRQRAGFWELRFATPAGGMASSVLELSRFISLQLAPYGDAEPTILSPHSIREMHRVHHMIDPARGGYGLGWGVEISNEQHVIYHGGELPEQTSFLLIDLVAQIGVVVLTNAQDVDAGSIAQEILRTVRCAVDPDAAVPTQAIPPA